MNFFMTTRWGAVIEQPDEAAMKQVLDELDAEDTEHPDVSMEHESGWTIGCFPSGLVTWENVEEDGPQHMQDYSRDQMLALWLMLAQGRLSDIHNLPWQAGYGND